MSDLHWNTSITKIEPNKISVRGYPIADLLGNVSYPQMVYLLFKGELPEENVGKMIDAILVSSVDHGTSPPSSLSAITVASTGAAGPAVQSASGSFGRRRQSDDRLTRRHEPH